MGWLKVTTMATVPSARCTGDLNTTFKGLAGPTAGCQGTPGAATPITRVEATGLGKPSGAACRA